jgi:creatinine amidohydrolase
MNWLDLTGDDFKKAIRKAAGVCLVPIGCVERHGHHLPVGTDQYIARALCERVARVEPAVIFPDMCFTQILEARHCAGTVALSPELITNLLAGVCAEIGRNGFKKIVLVNAHGGNHHFLRFFIQSQLARRRDYVVYLASPALSAADAKAVQKQWMSSVDGHAGESETSQMLCIRPDLVKRSAIPKTGEGLPKNHARALTDAGAITATGWYADHPTHYRGDANPAAPAKGEKELAATAAAIARIVRAIKKDAVSAKLAAAFFKGAESPA